ncbi:extracellular solute-binding protein [Herbaspirillum sp. RTI4]|uniref:extracellular solute-binding protein n=1 Tax=Herbaspirillum sp. RTI4 TaxID=3048640 RepID=UPI002AB55FE6|nr:extracellular solute-binding protein [Herbaspirillum sp. RTI4]MDY7579623.1 extracellular solute-binding protein [Herbaspirillum sp. RTI4]MEA9981838.1 extracellular solute-binding protein [Herbaspirillum sp. RTI4]
MLKRLALRVSPAIVFTALSIVSGIVSGIASNNAHAAHAFSLYDTPKYPPGFTHFDYVNPDAPQGGTLYLANPDRRTSFDKFNPFSLKGVAAAGVAGLMFETLAVGSSDEIASMYGLLADDMQLAPDRMAMTFHLNPAARFNNGDPVLAADVKYSFDTLMAKGAPQIKSGFADIAQCVVLDRLTVRFDFKNKNRELPLIAGGLPVFSRKWAAGTPFDKIQLIPPIVSGPYLIDEYDAGRSIRYRRNPAYWGKQLPVRIGTYNFNRIAYRFYKDDVARLEAFKAGEFDVSVEMSAKNWMRAYTGPKFTSGDIVKREFAHSNGAGMQGFIMNLRRPLFQDPRVRQALALALDFEWMNRQLFYNQYRRIDSFFGNSDLAARGTPQGEERALLESLRAAGNPLDPAVFGPASIPPSTVAPGSLRANLLQARELLRQAGWVYRDGQLRNAKGEPFAFEIIDDQSAMSRVISIYVRNLQKLGIQVSQRTADYALIAKRMEDFDYDMTSMRFGDISSPGNELFDMFGSRAADENGSNNLWGLKDPTVDLLVKAIVAADSRRELAAAARALDRVLLHKYLVVPHWYSASHRVAYRNRFGMPAKLPLYYQADAYVLSTWWEVTPK